MPITLGCARYSHLKEKITLHQLDGVLGAFGFSHLEVLNTNRTLCADATDSKGVRICPHLEFQLIGCLVNAILGAFGFSHLEVLNTNRTLRADATDSQVREYART